jgi:hypothetical protein
MVKPPAHGFPAPGTTGPAKASPDTVAFQFPPSVSPDHSIPQASPGSTLPPFSSSFFGSGTSAREIFKQAAVVLGLPQDTLTSALLAFTRFFALSPGGDLLPALRREVLAAGTSLPKDSRRQARTEAEALAAAAAAAKGVKLSEEALENYAGSLLEPWNTDSEGSFTGQEEQGGKEACQDSPDGCPGPGELQKLFEKFVDSGEDGGIAGLLNRIPGKNGQRWLVWPFKISSGGTDLRILIRLLIGGSLSSVLPHHRPGRLIADIAGSRRCWRFVLDNTGEGKLKADINVFPEITPAALKNLEREAKGFLGAGVEILVRNGDVLSSFADFLAGEILPSVHEEA